MAYHHMTMNRNFELESDIWTLCNKPEMNWLLANADVLLLFGKSMQASNPAAPLWSFLYFFNQQLVFLIVSKTRLSKRWHWWNNWWEMRYILF